MKQQSNQNTAIARAKAIKTSPQKMNLVLKMIRGKHVDEAYGSLLSSRKKVSNDIAKVLRSAISNAENNHDLDIDKLYISEATVGKAFTLKRWDARARGRAVRILKPYSNVCITLIEREV